MSGQMKIINFWDWEIREMQKGGTGIIRPVTDLDLLISGVEVGDIVNVGEAWCRSLSKAHYTGNPDDHGGENDPCYGYRADMKYTCGRDVPAAAYDTRLWSGGHDMEDKHVRYRILIDSMVETTIRDLTIEQIHELGFKAGDKGPAITFISPEVTQKALTEKIVRYAFHFVWNTQYGVPVRGDDDFLDTKVVFISFTSYDRKGNLL